ncbi:histidine kinase [Mucilaginibacter gynuensis]|uniref:Histidine kinase n=1 Tax=Mucilaginibacter gynuensis TaxID=1302236 RepID=A0ABP8GES4_9SPHI
MFKAYQIKWYFILTGILAVSSLLLRQISLRQIELWEYFDFFFRLLTTTITCWLIHGYFLLHKFSFNNTIKQFLSNAAAIAGTMILSYLFARYLPTTHLNDPPTAPNIGAVYMIHFMRAFFLSIICYIVFYSIHANTALQSSKLENEILEQAHLRAQLLSLQQQISPHFLFNSLSTLKTIAVDQPTKNYVVQLAAVYRYVLNFNEQYLTELQDELTFIRSYLYIMGERYEDALQVKIEIPDSHFRYQIPPLSLQLLVENAIKHNTIAPDQPLHILITTNDSPALIVENNFQPKKIPDESTGTGLKNIRERYKLLFHQPIQVLNEGGKFSVTLPLLIK